MRSTSTMSTPMPITLIGNFLAWRCRDLLYHRPAERPIHLAYSPVVILHSREHFAHGVFPAHKNCTRNDGVPDVEVGQMRNSVNERDVSVIDAMAGVDLKF